MANRIRMIEEYSFERFVQQCGSNSANLPDGCIISRGTLSSGYRSSLLRMDAYILLLCTEGEMRVTQNMQTYVVCRNSLFVYLPNTVVQVECVEACSLTYVMVTPDYFCRHYCYWQQVLPLMIQTRYKSLIVLSVAESREYTRMTDCLLGCMRRANRTGWQEEAVSSGIKMLLYTLFAQIKVSTEYTENIQEVMNQNRAEEYFARFMKLLSMYYKQERRVDFYASKLCVTPKYFSSVVKQVSGKSPVKWIDGVVMEEVQYLLKYSSISIKEIAYQLNFPNLSFFGKYFKRYTGVSPLRYRANDKRLAPVLVQSVG